MTAEQIKKLHLADHRVCEADRAFRIATEKLTTIPHDNPYRLELLAAEKHLKEVLVDIHIPACYEYLFV